MIGLVLEMGLPIWLAAEPGASASGSVDWMAILFFLRDIVTVASLAGGLFFVFAGAIGVIRLPDFFTRLHAAGMTDTLGAELIIFALILQADGWQMIAKLLLVAFFLLVTSPTATHAVAHAAYRSGIKPILGEYRAPDPDKEEA